MAAASTCAVSWRISSSDSGSRVVTIATRSPSCSGRGRSLTSPSCSGRVRSLTSPSTLTARAARASPAPMEDARSAPLAPSGSSLADPSGSTTRMGPDASRRCLSRFLRTGVRSLLPYGPRRLFAQLVRAPDPRHAATSLRPPSITENDAVRVRARAAKDVIMRPTTTTALPLACAALALPAGVALAQTNDDPPSPVDSALAAPFLGHLTMNAHMRAERREALVERFTPRVIRTERRTAHVNGAHFSLRAHKRRLAGQTPAELRHSLH